jgi:hypothetical protein
LRPHRLESCHLHKYAIEHAPLPDRPAFAKHDRDENAASGTGRFFCYFFHPMEQTALTVIKNIMKKLAAAAVALTIVSIAAVVVSRSTPPHDASDRNVPGKTTGPGRNSLVSPDK